MAVRIRLTRVGATKRPAYRVVAIDKRRSRDGRALEILGYYDPLTEPATVKLDTEKINAWIGKGAQPSETVAKLMALAERQAKDGGVPEKPKRATRPSTKPSKKQRAKGATEVDASATPEPAVEAEAPETSGAAEAPTAEAAAEAAPDAPEAAEAAEEAEAPTEQAEA